MNKLKRYLFPQEEHIIEDLIQALKEEADYKAKLRIDTIYSPTNGFDPIANKIIKLRIKLYKITNNNSTRALSLRELEEYLANRLIDKYLLS